MARAFPLAWALLLPLLLLLQHAHPTLSQPLTLPALPYAYDALEPVISSATMRSHHLAHHQAYTDNVNAVLVELRSQPLTKPLTKLGLDHLLTHIHNASLPLSDAQRRQLRNHGGGYINHELYFDNLTPPLALSGDDDGGRQRLTNVSHIPDQLPHPTSQVLALLTSTFGSFESFRDAFTAAAMSVFGSGWGWLILDGQSHALRIEITTAQDSPLMEDRGHTILLALDMWEHSFYLDHQSRRRAYVDGFWKVVNWEVVEHRLVQAKWKTETHRDATPTTHEELR